MKLLNIGLVRFGIVLLLSMTNVGVASTQTSKKPTFEVISAKRFLLVDEIELNKRKVKDVVLIKIVVNNVLHTFGLGGGVDPQLYLSESPLYFLNSSDVRVVVLVAETPKDLKKARVWQFRPTTRS